jgi:hypothetical protein
MADDTSATIIPLHQPQKRRPKTGAERARAYRLRKKAAAPALPVPVPMGTPVTILAPLPRPVVTSRVTLPSRRPAASYLLAAAAFGLGAVGVTMNGWFARSLGATETAGWLFLAVGVAADCVALTMPACAARLWQAGQRVTASAGWAVWAMTFLFALQAGVGFASVNIADVTLARASRVTPAVTAAETALSDAMTSRDRECKGGVGKFCRERESAVNDRRQALDAAMQAVRQTADPQIDAATRIVAWATRGLVRPSGDDFSMLRLALLALLPQIGGILLLVSRSKPPAKGLATP